jgi:hypothetical protein
VFRPILLLAALCFSQTYNLRGVEIYSTNVVHFGRWETRMKAAATPGTVSSFFVYYPNSSASSTGTPYPWREIDIEVLGKSGFGFQSNLITGTAANQTTSEAYHTLAFDLSSSYHTYTLDWTPDSVVWRIDGTTVRKTTSSSQQVVDLRDSSDTYRMNLWASNSPSWAGTLDTSKLPVLQIVHWMRYSAYTPNAGPGGSNFTPSWTDSFQNINTSRWAFGNWTFTGNYATFTNSNAKVQNGYLVMMLSTVGKMGQFPSSFPRDTAGTTGLQERNGFLHNHHEFVVAGATGGLGFSLAESRLGGLRSARATDRTWIAVGGWPDPGSANASQGIDPGAAGKLGELGDFPERLNTVPIWY